MWSKRRLATELRIADFVAVAEVAVVAFGRERARHRNVATRATADLTGAGTQRVDWRVGAHVANGAHIDRACDRVIAVDRGRTAGAATAHRDVAGLAGARAQAVERHVIADAADSAGVEGAVDHVVAVCRGGAGAAGAAAAGCVAGLAHRTERIERAVLAETRHTAGVDCAIDRVIALRGNQTAHAADGRGAVVFAARAARQRRGERTEREDAESVSAMSLHESLLHDRTPITAPLMPGQAPHPSENEAVHVPVKLSLSEKVPCSR